jgi:hypothetical protein
MKKEQALSKGGSKARGGNSPGGMLLVAENEARIYRNFIAGAGSRGIGVGSLFVGGTNRGWGSTSRKPFALERCSFTGEVPFEILTMKAKSDGFVLTFTQPIDAKTAADLASYKMDAYTYIYQSGYGSPVVDKSTPTITSASISPGKKSVTLKIDGLVKGHVHELKAAGLRNAEDEALLHGTAYYTLNEIPKR